MKKLILTIIATISFCISLFADTINGRFYFREDGNVAGECRLYDDGTFYMYVDDEVYRGTYYIDGDYAPGSSYPIYFTIDGERYRGDILWAMNGEQGVSFSGIYFEK